MMINPHHIRVMPVVVMMMTMMNFNIFFLIVIIVFFDNVIRFVMHNATSQKAPVQNTRRLVN
ncbi:hypothetical protein EGD17_05415 [Salmonella enterica]|nr:hypothetical protein [Salmonella enterica]EDO3063839.1 hypothetical protein [Salmonella enterica subsp. enterica serovar Anatum]